MYFPVILIQFLLGFDLCDAQKGRQSFPRVITPLGTIEGYYNISNNGRRYEAYEGIPYAEPPIGKLRFHVSGEQNSIGTVSGLRYVETSQVPRSIAPWTGILLAKSFGPICMQLDQKTSGKIVGSEDCLYMNVYTPAIGSINEKAEHGKSISAELLPVVFCIHGGGFYFGSGSELGPKFLLDSNVIVVTFNYRLGPFGFLSTGDKTVCGNMGLKDQVIALRWVNDNIQYFGGDPSRITIFGQSAGGASVHYHYLSKLSAGLFQRGMSMSGTALDNWAQMECPLQKAKNFSRIVGCSTENVSLMVNCLKDQSAHHIYLAFEKFYSQTNGIGPFAPVVETEGCEFTFNDRSPIETIVSGQAHDLPWITGTVSDEGLYFVSPFLVNDTSLEYLNDNWRTLAPNLLNYYYTVPKHDHSRVARLVREHYLGTSPISWPTVNQTVQMIGDRVMVYNDVEAALLQARFQQSPVWYYAFSYRGAHSYSEIAIGSTKNFGVDHTDDIAYIFETPVNTSTTPEDRAMQRKMTDLLVSYATYGKPAVGVRWPTLSGSRKQLDYLHIAGPCELRMESSMDYGQKDFWESLGIQENRLTREGHVFGLNCF